MGYEFSSRIRYSETDQNQKLTIPHLADYYQDCTVFHDAEAGFGVDFWRERGTMWVLGSCKFLIFRMPQCGENVTIRTDAISVRRCIGERNFTMRGEDGKMIAAGYGKYAMVDLKTGKPRDVPPDLGDRYGYGDPLPMVMEKGRILDVPDTETPEPFPVSRHHIDTNHHVNNAQYMQMMMDYLPRDFDIRMMRVSFHRSAVLGDVIYTHIARDGNIIRARLSDESGEPYVIFYFSEEMDEEDRKVGEL